MWIKAAIKKIYFHTQIQLCATFLILTKIVAQFQVNMGECIKKNLQIFYQYEWGWVHSITLQSSRVETLIDAEQHLRQTSHNDGK